jgi:large subunit ribosomal protein L33
MIKRFFILDWSDIIMRKKVILVCEECLSRNYTTTKNPAKTGERIELKKFCSTCNKYTIHKETR